MKKTKKQILDDDFEEQDVMKFGDDSNSLEDASPWSFVYKLININIDINITARNTTLK